MVYFSVSQCYTTVEKFGVAWKCLDSFLKEKQMEDSLMKTEIELHSYYF